MNLDTLAREIGCTLYDIESLIILDTYTPETTITDQDAATIRDRAKQKGITA